MGTLDGHRAIVTGGGSRHRRRGVPPLRRARARRSRCSTGRGDAADAIARRGRRCRRSRATSPTRSQVARAVEAAADALGGVTDLVNNAGMGRNKPLHEYSDDEWDLVVGVNLTGRVLLHARRDPAAARRRRRLHREQRVAERAAAAAGRGAVLRGEGRAS